MCYQHTHACTSACVMRMRLCRSISSTLRSKSLPEMSCQPGSLLDVASDRQRQRYCNFLSCIK